MKMKKRLLTLLPLLLSLHVSAQTFTGKVVDEHSSPIGYATVILLSGEEAQPVCGCVTGDDGAFSLDAAAEREYLLRVSFLGFATFSCRSLPADLGTIVLVPDETVLDEEVVQGRVPLYGPIAGGISANVSDTVLSRTGTAGDAIGHLPGVRRKPDGTFEVIGKGEPLIVIDNRKVRDRSELDRLPSDAIRRMELLTSPGAEYDASVGAVIRIETVAADRDGFSFGVDSSVDFTCRTNTSQQLDWDFQRGKTELFGSFRYDLSHDRARSESDITTFAGSVWNQTVASVDRSETQRLYGRIGLNYEANPRHSFGILYELTSVPASSMSNETRTEVRVDGAEYDVWNTFDTAVGRSRPQHHLNAYWSGAFGPLSVAFDADALLGCDTGSESVREYGANSRPVTLDTEERTETGLYAGKILLSLPVGGGRVSAGSEYTHTRRRACSTGYAGVLAGTDDRIEDRNLALFLGYDAAFGKVELKAGLRYEHVIYDFYENDVWSPDESKRYDNLFPILSLHGAIGQVRLSLDCRIRTERPAYEMLKSAVHYGNRLTCLSGTPDLQPTRIRSVELGGRYRDLLVSVGFQNCRDDICFVAEPLEPGSEVSVNRFRNLDRRNLLVCSVSFSPSVGRWRPEWSVSGNTQWLDLPHLNGSKSMNGTVFLLQWGNAFLLPANFLLRIDGEWMSPGCDRNQRQRSSGFVSVSLNKEFSGGRWSLMLEANDLFRTRRTASWQYDLQNLEYRAGRAVRDR